jgi:hypothetical protein
MQLSKLLKRLLPAAAVCAIVAGSVASKRPAVAAAVPTRLPVPTADPRDGRSVRQVGGRGMGDTQRCAVTALRLERQDVPPMKNPDWWFAALLKTARQRARKNVRTASESRIIFEARRSCGREGGRAGVGSSNAGEESPSCAAGLRPAEGTVLDNVQAEQLLRASARKSQTDGKCNRKIPPGGRKC